MCAEAPPTGLGACATSGRSISNTAPTAAVYVPLQQVKRDFQLPAAAAAATASGAAVPQPPSPAAAVLSIFTTGYALAGGVGGGGGGRCGGATAGNATVEVCDILAPPAADSHNAGAAGNAASALRGSAPLVPQYNSAPIRPYVNNRTILPYLASRHMSQVRVYVSCARLLASMPFLFPYQHCNNSYPKCNENPKPCTCTTTHLVFTSPPYHHYVFVLP